MEEGEMGEKKTKAQGHISAPFFRVIYGANLARRLYRPYTPVNPGQKALWAVYALQTSLIGQYGEAYGLKDACKAWK